MIAKEYLSQYESHKRKNKIFLSEYKIEIEEIRNIRKHMSVIPAPQRRQAEKNLNKCIMFCNGLRERAKKSAIMMDEIQALIESVPGLEGEILQLRYIDGLIWEDICERVCYSWNGVFKHHRMALRMVQDILDMREDSDEPYWEYR